MGKITVSAFINKQCLRKDNTYSVKIKLYCNGKNKILSTNISARKDQLYKDLKIRDVQFRTYVENMVNEYRDAINAIPVFEANKMTVEEVAETIMKVEQKKDFQLDFVAFGRNIAAEKSKKPAGVYNSALNALCEFAGKDIIDISEIKSSFLHKFEDYLRSTRGSSSRTVSSYTSCMSYIHKRARMQYNDYESNYILINNPFEFYKPPKQMAAKHRNIELDTVQKMIDTRASLESRQRLGVDLFLISFALMGCNTPDIYDMMEPKKKDILKYNRTKTRGRRSDQAEMLVKIPACIKPILQEHKGKDGYLLDFREHYSNYDNLAKYANKGLITWADENGVTEHITMYSARHTWATTAYSIGIDKSTINSCLCHVDEMAVTDIYINKDWSILWKANDKVLSQLEWK